MGTIEEIIRMAKDNSGIVTNAMVTADDGIVPMCRKYYSVVVNIVPYREYYFEESEDEKPKHNRFKTIDSMLNIMDKKMELDSLGLVTEGLILENPR